MDQRLRNYYFETRVAGSSPGQLLIMLYDALVQNAESAESEIAASASSPERAEAPRSISRCLDIVTELSTALKHEVDPELCATLSNLYRFFAGEFSAALSKGAPEKIRAILPLLRDLRSTWEQALKRSGYAQPVAA